MFRTTARGLDTLGAGVCRRARAVDDDLDILEITVRQIAGIDNPGRSDDSGAVLVVMEHGDVHSFAQRMLDHEAFGRLDILQIDAAEARLQQCDRVNKGVDILCIQFKVVSIDITDTLDPYTLDPTYRHRSMHLTIPAAKNSRAIGKH